MRILIAAIMAIFALGTLNAEAAQARQACKGSTYACSTAAKSAHVTTSKKTHARHATSKKRYATVAHSKKRYAKVAHSKKRYAKSTKRSTRVAKRAAPVRSYAGGTLSGKASYYWQPQALASGGRFNPNAMTAAHKTLPFGTRVSVTNLNNGRSVVVSINDRGPYIAGRIIDLSKAAAYKIGMQNSGVVPVRVAILGRG